MSPLATYFSLRKRGINSDDAWDLAGMPEWGDKLVGRMIQIVAVCSLLIFATAEIMHTPPAELWTALSALALIVGLSAIGAALVYLFEIMDERGEQ